MYRKSLAIETELGRKEGMAADYGNLGNVHQTRGELDAAVDMYRKALAINTELGHKEGMAIQYGNLGIVHKTRGELDEARAAWRESVRLYQAVGVPHRVKEVQGWLDGLP